MPVLHAVRGEEGGAGDRPTDSPRVDRAAAGLVPGTEEGVGRATHAYTLGRGGEHQRHRLRVTGNERLLRIDVFGGFDNLQADRGVGEWDGEVDD